MRFGLPTGKPGGGYFAAEPQSTLNKRAGTAAEPQRAIKKGPPLRSRLKILLTKPIISCLKRRGNGPHGWFP